VEKQKPDSIGEVEELLARAAYVSGRDLATVVYLCLSLEKPLFVEGRPGVGKTELALSLARSLGRELIRLQCYEGLDATQALYEWNYPKQLLRIRLEEAAGRDPAQVEPAIFSDEYLIDRPLLRALRAQSPSLLLIDELDRSDEEFEAFLLEILSDFQITIPEIGTISAEKRPVVVITSNRTREIHDAIKRRCFYHWIEYPDFDKEMAVIKARLPEVEERLAAQVVGFLQRLREMDLVKLPGLSETLDWAQALVALHAHSLGDEVVEQTLGCLLKYHQDLIRFQEEVWSVEERRSAFLGGSASC